MHTCNEHTLCYLLRKMHTFGCRRTLGSKGMPHSRTAHPTTPPPTARVADSLPLCTCGSRVCVCAHCVQTASSGTSARHLGFYANVFLVNEWTSASSFFPRGRCTFDGIVCVSAGTCTGSRVCNKCARPGLQAASFTSHCFFFSF